MTNEDKDPVLEKLDAIEQRLTALETPPPPPDPTEKIDARDISLKRGIEFFKTYLEGVLPKQKLDTLTFDELVLASELKAQIKPNNLNPAPPIEHTDTDDRPAWLRATVEGS